MQQISSQKAAEHWYLITNRNSLSLKIVREVTVGEDETGKLVINGKHTDQQWLTLALNGQNELLIARVSPEFQLQAAKQRRTLSVGDALGRGTVVETDNNILYISGALQEGRVLATIRLVRARSEVSKHSTRNPSEAIGGFLRPSRSPRRAGSALLPEQSAPTENDGALDAVPTLDDILVPEPVSNEQIQADKLKALDKATGKEIEIQVPLIEVDPVPTLRPVAEQTERRPTNRPVSGQTERRSTNRPVAGQSERRPKNRTQIATKPKRRNSAARTLSREPNWRSKALLIVVIAATTVFGWWYAYDTDLKIEDLQIAPIISAFQSLLMDGQIDSVSSTPDSIEPDRNEKVSLVTEGDSAPISQPRLHRDRSQMPPSEHFSDLENARKIDLESEVASEIRSEPDDEILGVAKALVEQKRTVPDVSALLLEAEQLVDQGYITWPERNAIVVLDQILAAEPGHTSALALREQAAYQLVRQAEDAIEDGFTASGLETAEQVLRFYPDFGPALHLRATFP